MQVLQAGNPILPQSLLGLSAQSSDNPAVLIKQTNRSQTDTTLKNTTTLTLRENSTILSVRNKSIGQINITSNE